MKSGWYRWDINSWNNDDDIRARRLIEEIRDHCADVGCALPLDPQSDYQRLKKMREDYANLQILRRQEKKFSLADLSEKNFEEIIDRLLKNYNDPQK